MCYDLWKLKVGHIYITLNLNNRDLPFHYASVFSRPVTMTTIPILVDYLTFSNPQHLKGVATIRNSKKTSGQTTLWRASVGLPTSQIRATWTRVFSVSLPLQPSLSTSPNATSPRVARCRRYRGIRLLSQRMLSQVAFYIGLFCCCKIQEVHWLICLGSRRKTIADI